MAFASQTVLWSVPQTVLYIRLPVSCGFGGQMAVALEKVLVGSANSSGINKSSMNC